MSEAHAEAVPGPERAGWRGWRWAGKGLWSVRIPRLHFRGEETGSDHKASKQQDSSRAAQVSLLEKSRCVDNKGSRANHMVWNSFLPVHLTLPSKEEHKMKAVKSCAQEEGPSGPHSWSLGIYLQWHLKREIHNWVVVVILLRDQDQILSPNKATP